MMCHNLCQMWKKGWEPLLIGVGNILRYVELKYISYAQRFLKLSSGVTWDILLHGH